VTLITTSKTHIAPWGIDVQTVESVWSSNTAKLKAKVKVMNREEGDVVRFSIAGKDFDLPFKSIHGLAQNSVASDEITLEGIEVWDPSNPILYEAKVSIIKANGKVVDTKTFKYGIRTISYEDRGISYFYINGKPYKFKGVCLHHDLGMLGAAVNKAALLHQLMLLKSMGCNAIRTSHNMPSQWQMELCDSLGIMVMAEYSSGVRSRSSRLVPDRTISIAGKILRSDRRLSRTSSILPVPLNSSNTISSILLPVSIRAVARMVRLPPSRIFLAAPKNLLGICRAAGSRPPERVRPLEGSVIL
jgi:hypothetical protein